MPDFKEIAGRLADALMEVVFPTKCLVCGTFFPPPLREDLVEKDVQDITYQRVMSPFLCPNCLIRFLPPSFPICAKCGTRMESRGGNEVCRDCSEFPKHFRVARAFGAYEKEGEIFARAIRCFKYDEKTQLARPYEKLLFATFIRHWNKADIDIVMPVPLHIKRMRKRGFNQAYLLIRKWHRLAESFNIDLSNIRIEREILIRNKNTIPQVEMTDRTERMENIRGAFVVRNPSKIRGKKILLVDDVHTTGATVDECAKVLSETGAEYTDVLTLART
ncbi:ComF family protein [Desulfococcaceae bacterium HSG8]|nr:ComF family protein [Desulfococcaceae bacterium HSG8]